MIVWTVKGKLSGLFCAILCAQCNAHMNRPNSSLVLDWVLSHSAIFVYILFCVSLYIACMCRIVTWWGGPGGIEACP